MGRPDKKAKQKCSFLNEDGKRCGSWPVKGTALCISHSDEAVKAAVGFGGAENGAKGGAATKKPKLSDMVRERLEEKADYVIDKLFAGLEAERSFVVGDGPDAFVDTEPDMAIRLRTVQEIFNRAEGRPKSVSEFTGVVEHRHMDQLDREIERLAEEMARRAAEEEHADRSTA